MSHKLWIDNVKHWYLFPKAMWAQWWLARQVRKFPGRRLAYTDWSVDRMNGMWYVKSKCGQYFGKSMWLKRAVELYNA